MDNLWTILAGALMVAGLVGIFIPFFPDLFLIWAAALGYGLLVGWEDWGPWLFGLVTLLGVLGILAETYVGGAGARAAGASYKAIFAGLILGTIGFFVFPPFGLIIGLLVGTFAVEFLRLRDWRQAGRAMLGMGIGYGVSFGVKLGFGALMIGAWLVWVVWG
ncbi:MAG: DUF456 domain-containing protein [Anaerolineales bacterium]